jgi:UDP-GlcNAc:undecaprenyl-phosphate GlcNAc-1-phosphate transferase
MPYAILSLLAVACGTSLLLTPITRRIGARLGLLDCPHERKLQKAPVPRTGGIGVLCGLVAGGVFLATLSSAPRLPLGRELIAVLLGGVLIHLIGIWDDRRDLSAKRKLIVQTLVVGGVMSQGFVLGRVDLPLAGSVELGIFAYPVTAFFLLGFINALNLVDGLDGLAGGIGAIISLTLLVTGLVTGNGPLAVLAALLLGAILGFLPYNFLNGKTFLGDAGSTLIGYMLGVTAIAGSRFAGDSTPALVAAGCALVPAFDTATTIWRRCRSGRGLFHADSMHIHHRLIRFGMTPGRAVLVILSVTLFAAGQTFAFLVQGARSVFAVTSLAALLVLFSVWDQRRRNTVAIEATFREILFYLLGAQNGPNPRWDGQLAIGEVLAAPESVEEAAPASSPAPPMQERIAARA